MRLSTYSWETGTYITGNTFADLRVVLDQGLHSAIEKDGNVLIIKVPIPALKETSDKSGTERDMYIYQDIEFSQSSRNWKRMWALFSAALLHGSFHKDQSSFETYRQWSAGKPRKKALETLAFVEDIRVTLSGLEKNPGFGAVVGYANYISLFVNDEEERRILLDVWGTPDSQVLGLVKSGNLKDALDTVYQYPVIPRLAYADVRSGIAEPREPTTPPVEDDRGLVERMLKVVGITLKEGWDNAIKTDALDFMTSIRSFYHLKDAVNEKFKETIEGTLLDGVDFPINDYGEFLETKAALAGPIRSIRNRLVMLKNEEDEILRQRAGYPDLPEVIQMLASGKSREDVFVRNEPEHTDISWVILADTSKSMESGINTVKGVITCLSEVAKDLIPHFDEWAIYAFDTQLKVIKDFSEPYTNDSRARIGGLAPSSLTYFPDAVLAVSKALLKRSGALKVLIVISDGEPLGYAGIREKMVSTMKELSKSPIIMLGLGIQSADMKKYFRSVVKIDKPYEMMKFFVTKYVELASSA
jgi:hypothetical protein